MSKTVINKHIATSTGGGYAASDLQPGEIGINYLSGKEAIYIKNSRDEIIPFITSSATVNAIKKTKPGQFYSGSLSGEVFNDYSSNIAEGNYSHAEGTRAQAIGDYSHAGGDNVVSKGAYSFSHGFFLSASNTNEIALGKCNVSTTGGATSATTLFSIGNGSTSQRSNAIEIKNNGDIYINNVGNFNGYNSNTKNVFPLNSIISDVCIGVMDTGLALNSPKLVVNTPNPDAKVLNVYTRYHYSGTGIIQLYVNNEGPFNIIADISADALSDDKLRGPLRGTIVLSLYKASSSTYLIIGNPIVYEKHSLGTNPSWQFFRYANGWKEFYGRSTTSDNSSWTFPYPFSDVDRMFISGIQYSYLNGPMAIHQLSVNSIGVDFAYGQRNNKYGGICVCGF